MKYLITILTLLMSSHELLSQLIIHESQYENYPDSIRHVYGISGYSCLEGDYSIEQDGFKIDLCVFENNLPDQWVNIFGINVPNPSGASQYEVQTFTNMFEIQEGGCVSGNPGFLDSSNYIVDIDMLNNEYLGLDVENKGLDAIYLSQHSIDTIKVLLGSYNYLGSLIDQTVNSDLENEISLDVCCVLDEDGFPGINIIECLIPVDENILNYLLKINLYNHDSILECSFDDSLIIDFIHIPFNNPITSSIESNHLNDSGLFEVFPNPANDLLNIKRNISAPSELTILNNLGQTISTHLLQSQESKIDCSGLAPGVYYLQIGSQSVQKLLVTSN